MRHQLDFSNGVDLTTVAYRNDFARNRYRLARMGGTGLGAILANPALHADKFAWMTGQTSPDDALVVRNNNRSYRVQSVLGLATRTGEVDHQVEVGRRWHEDSEDRFQDDDRYRMDNGRMVTTDGLPGTQDIRIGEARAWSVYVQDEIRANNWIVVPGLRYEDIDLTRTDFARRPDGRSDGPTREMESSGRP